MLADAVQRKGAELRTRANAPWAVHYITPSNTVPNALTVLTGQPVNARKQKRSCTQPLTGRDMLPQAFKIQQDGPLANCTGPSDGCLRTNAYPICVLYEQQARPEQKVSCTCNCTLDGYGRILRGCRSCGYQGINGRRRFLCHRLRRSAHTLVKTPPKASQFG